MLGRKSDFKLFVLEIGDMDNKQTFRNHLTWEQYVKNNRNPSNFTSKTTHTHKMEWNEIS